jgi:hypothetical protein
MPKLFNTVTKKWEFMPDSYVGKFPFKTEAEMAPEPEVVSIVTEKVVSKSKKKAEYTPEAADGDGDGLVQDGTVFERPFGTELSPEEVTAILEETEEE